MPSETSGQASGQWKEIPREKVPPRKGRGKVYDFDAMFEKVTANPRIAIEIDCSYGTAFKAVKAWNATHDKKVQITTRTVNDEKHVYVMSA